MYADMLFEVLVNLIEIIFTVNLLNSALKRKNILRNLGGAILLFTIQSLINFLRIDSSVSFLIMIMADVLYAFYCFDDESTKKIFWGCMYPVIVISAQNITFLLLSQRKIDLENIMESGDGRGGAVVIYLVISGILVLILSNLKSKDAYLPFGYQIFMVVCVIAGCIIINKMSDLTLTLNEAGSDIMRIIDILCILILFLLISMLFMIRKLGEIFEQRRIEFMERKQYEIINSSIVELRSWKHDFKNNLLMIQKYIEDKRYLELDKYISQLENEMEKNRRIISTGNYVIDTIVSFKLIIAKKQGIVTKHEIYLPENTILKAAELAVVLGNILDNAIEACSGVTGERYISIKIKPYRQMLGICVENSFVGFYEYVNNKFLTHKKDEGHGYGLKRVEQIVYRAGGFIEYQPQKKVFRITIMIPMEK